MKSSKLIFITFNFAVCLLFFAFGLTAICAQSTNQSYPTAITSNELSGRIAARDIGDPRLTSYFFVFNGAQGDIFINIKTTNLDGDIDIFTAENLRPLTKIKVFSDASDNETGRVLYLRKPEKLILRIEGRSPNDEAATYSLKFAGSFVPAQAVAETDSTEQPQVKSENQGDVRVNSVGTIIEVKPKSTPKPNETIAKREPEKTKIETKEKTVVKEPENNEANTTETENDKETAAKEKETIAKKETTPKKRVPRRVPGTKPKQTDDAVAAKKEASETPTVFKTKPKKSAEAAKPVEPNPLENVQLRILFKDGTKIERPMSEVLRVGVDKGILTLITKDGAIARYSILDVARMTIE